MQESNIIKNILGIDLGSSFTLLARYNEAGHAELTFNLEGNQMTPSVIQLDSSGEVIVGTDAKKFLGTGMTNVFAEFKRDMGTDKTWQFGKQLITPVDLTALLLKKVVADYTLQYGEPDTIVITWPSSYRDEQRQSTKEAAKLAGLNVEYFIEEPLAAALYYGIDKPLSGKYVIYNFGGTAFSVSLIEANGNIVSVICQDGIQQLGGKDLDAALLKIIGKKFRAKISD
jgi:molecular chaperone DnaK (HSP70)